MRDTYRIACVGGMLIAATLLGGCSSSSSGTVPRAAATAGPLITTAMNSARGTMQAVMGTLHAHVLTAEFIRPSLGAMIPATGVAAATCDPNGSASATGTTSDLPQAYFFTRFAFYPPGDTTCSQAPIAFGVFAYPNPSGQFAPQPGQPLVAQGYLVSYAPSGDPYYTPGALMSADGLTATVYGAADGQANVALQIFGSDGYVQVPLPGRPPAGAFPASFPNFAPNTITGQPQFQKQDPMLNTALVAVEHGGAIAESVVTDPNVLFNDGTVIYQQNGIIPGNGSSTQGLLAGANTFTSTSTPAAGAAGIALSGSSESPAYGIDKSNSRAIVLPNFPPAAGGAAIPFPAQSFALGSAIASSLNFPSVGIKDAGTFTFGGYGSGVDIAFVDATNQVEVEVTSVATGYALAITDLIAHKPMTSPATVQLDVLGNSQPFTYVADGTNGAVRNFVVTE